MATIYKVMTLVLILALNTITKTNGTIPVISAIQIVEIAQLQLNLHVLIVKLPDFSSIISLGAFVSMNALLNYIPNLVKVV